MPLNKETKPNQSNDFQEKQTGLSNLEYWPYTLFQNLFLSFGFEYCNLKQLSVFLFTVFSKPEIYQNSELLYYRLSRNKQLKNKLASRPCPTQAKRIRVWHCSCYSVLMVPAFFQLLLPTTNYFCLPTTSIVFFRALLLPILLLSFSGQVNYCSHPYRR